MKLTKLLSYYISSFPRDIWCIFIELKGSFTFKIKFFLNRVLIYLHTLTRGKVPRINLFRTKEIIIKNKDGVWKIRPDLGDGWIVCPLREKEIEKILLFSFT